MPLQPLSSQTSSNPLPEVVKRRKVFVAGGTGFVGRCLIPALRLRAHEVAALARSQSLNRLPSGCEKICGDVFDPASYEAALKNADTFIHLVGAAHPAPWKSKAFEQIDKASLTCSLKAAQTAAVRHFVYMSVAQPAPVMKSYVRIRSECENLLRKSGLAVTILRPWYILGPGRRWPVFLMPVYSILKRIPAMAARIERFDFVTVQQAAGAIIQAVEDPPEGVQVLEVAQIRNAVRSSEASMRLSGQDLRV